jgi:hypothetical protein
MTDNGQFSSWIFRSPTNDVNLNDIHHFTIFMTVPNKCHCNP